jgi:hypothetical protein
VTGQDGSQPANFWLTRTGPITHVLEVFLLQIGSRARRELLIETNQTQLLATQRHYVYQHKGVTR